ncbi:hypothetical protein J4222_04465 [Candidatus Woesearchaeota archaeon]|nr:hypothetical protein [Candidatus Woesearchaeota archaeon]
MSEKLLEEIRNRLDCLILLNCLKESAENEKLRVAVNCLGLSQTARLLKKDPSNLSKFVNKTKKSSD